MAKIIGNTTATPNPRPDWNQTDETKADYIKNKPIIGDVASLSEIAKDNLASDVQELLDIIPSISGLASEDYVDTKVASLVDSAPETLDTLNELATALGDDPNFATTVLEKIGEKADKSTTLEGYGIVDAYTKDDVHIKLIELEDGIRSDIENAETEISNLQDNKADRTEIPTKLSELDNDGGYVKNTDYATNEKAGLLRVAYGYGTQISSDGYLTIARCSKAEIDARINSTHPVTPDVLEYAVKSVGDGYYVKEPIVIIDTESTEYNINFLERHNHIIRCGTLHAMGFNFSNGEYPEDYGLDLSFDSGATPTSLSYSGSGILNWVGTDCTTSDGLSIFQPSANTHYDIVFYYNGNQFIGLVHGYVPASGNVVSE